MYFNLAVIIYSASFYGCCIRLFNQVIDNQIKVIYNNNNNLTQNEISMAKIMNEIKITIKLNIIKKEYASLKVDY